MSEDQIEDIIGRKTDDTIIPDRDTRTHIKSARRQDENGNTYLLAIDPYYYLRYAENILSNNTSNINSLSELVCNSDSILNNQEIIKVICYDFDTDGNLLVDLLVVY